MILALNKVIEAEMEHGSWLSFAMNSNICQDMRYRRREIAVEGLSRKGLERLYTRNLKFVLSVLQIAAKDARLLRREARIIVTHAYAPMRAPNSFFHFLHVSFFSQTIFFLLAIHAHRIQSCRDQKRVIIKNLNRVASKCWRCLLFHNT